MSVLPRERTSESRTGMSALGQSQTHAAKQIPHTAVMIYSINSSARPLSQRGKPLGAAIEERVGTDNERVGVKLGQGRKSFVEIAIGARLQPVELKSHDARGRLQLPHKNR